MSEILTPKERAAHIRAELKAMFLKTKFSVRSSSYSMGTNVSVHWTDGPTEEAVQNVIDCLVEDMLNLYDMSLETKYQGISITREISKEAWATVEAEVLADMRKRNDPYIDNEWSVKREISYELEERSFL